MKSPNLRHRQACSQNKGLNRANQLWTSTSPTRDRHVRAARAGRGKLQPQRSIIYQTVSRLRANQDFLGFWTVDIHQEGHSQRSAPQKRHTAHLRRWASCTPRKPSGRNGGGHKSLPLCSSSTWPPELLRPGKGTKHRPNQVYTFVAYPST